MRPRQLMGQDKPVDWSSHKIGGGKGAFGITGQLGGSTGRAPGGGDFGVSTKLGGTSAGSGAGDFGVPTHLGCKAVPNPDAGRRFSELPDGGRCCPPPKGMSQSNPRHMTMASSLPR
jgi:hypothetical protein